jgi:membrane-bound ClpP family serine protease
MRKLFLILAILFLVLSIVFAILPMGTIAFLPIALALISSLVLLKKSAENQRILPNWLLTLSAVCSFVVVLKIVFIKDKVEVDKKFEQQKVETKIEAKKELEELENDLE